MIYRFKIDNTFLTVELSDSVLAHFNKHAQHTDESPEAGGQLFANIAKDGSHWVVTSATGPRPSDKRSRFLFKPDRRIERREIHAEFVRGNHYVGDWHTHPQRSPQPSASDTLSMAEIFEKSIHQLPGVLMIIVGIHPPPEGIWISLHNSREAALPLSEQRR
ncbi:Mov34/MPN/PAD-1 family protein [Marinobacter sp. NFXS11]|uniref:Mov34/MPN/PAD-1 family protein n=1 Tax=Marinobacter sp. NFXS11 TaxID=2818432 RepID=UPI0032E0298D